MQQRRLRLGDILDDYCPRERRITNHAVVAMIDDQVKQTRCTTCDADHEYKQARVPASRRKKDGLPAVAAGLAAQDHDGDRPELDDQDAVTGDAIDDDAMEGEASNDELSAESDAAMNGEMDADADADTESDEPIDEGNRGDDGPVHRRLIRATLPRPEGQAPERKAPEFTVRQPGGRGRGEFDGNRTGGGGGGGAGQRNGRGRRPMRGVQAQPSGPSRFGGQRQNGPQGQGGQNGGNRPGSSGGGQPRGGARPQGQRGPGRKRGR